MILIGPVKSDIFRYRFNHYYQDKKFGVKKIKDFFTLYNNRFVRLKWNDKIKNKIKSRISKFRQDN